MAQTRSRSRSLLASVVLAAIALTTTAPAAPAEPAAGEVLIEEDFDDASSLPEDWEVVSGSWAVRDGRLWQDDQGGTPKIAFGEHLRDFRFEADVRFEAVNNDSRWLSLGLDVRKGHTQHAQAALRSRSTASNGVEFANFLESATWNVPAAAAAPADAAVGTDVRVSVEVHGTRGTWYFNGVKVLETNQLLRSQDGVLGLLMNGAKASFDNVRVTALEPLPMIEVVEPGTLGLVVAHRGNSAAVPENTLAAMDSARRVGADFLEMDLEVTSDGVVVLSHDTTVDRTTNYDELTGVTGTRVRSLPFEQIQQLDAGFWFSAGFAGLAMPSFEEILADAKTRGALLMPELKGEWTPADVRTLADLVHEYGLQDSVVFQSFSTGVLQLLLDNAPEIARAPLVSSLPADPVGLVQRYEGVALLPNHGMVTPELVGELHAEGIAVIPWTVNSPERWESLTQAGVDGIMTDSPAQLVGWQDRYAQDPTLEPEGVISATDAVVHQGEEQRLSYAVAGATGDLTVMVVRQGEDVGSTPPVLSQRVEDRAGVITWTIGKELPRYWSVAEARLKEGTFDAHLVLADGTTLGEPATFEVSRSRGTSR